mgnify:CR=1 FL=1
MVQNEETILIKLSGSLQKSQDIVSCFMRNGYNSLLISDHLKTCWKSWTIGISNEWELKNVIKKFQSVSILFLNLNIRFYDLITVDMEVDIDENLETKYKGLYVIGDGSGVTHSLSHASASGVYVADHIVNNQ